MVGDDNLLATLNVTLMACLLLLQRRRSRNAPRRYCVHPLWRYRDTEGQAHTLLPCLRARDEVYFRDFLRMPPRTFETLLSLVERLIEKRVTPFRLPISAHERLAMTLRFLANGDTFQSLTFNILTGRSTAGEIVRETTAVLWHVLQPLYMKFPQTTGEWKRIAADVEEFWNFPNRLGSIDGKHVVIDCPRNTGSRNLKYKKTFSVVFLAVCDAHNR
ncbi:hypothetical protein MRX96_020831 [Rhipicephalus microplus]